MAPAESEYSKAQPNGGRTKTLLGGGESELFSIMGQYRENGNGFQGKHTASFTTEVLQQLLTSRKSICIDLGIPYTTYAHWYEGSVSFPPDLIPNLYNACEYESDRELIIHFFLCPLDLIAVPKQDANSTKTDLQVKQLKLVSEVGKQFEQIQKALADGVLERKEYDAIHRLIDRGRVLEAEIDEALKAKVEEG